MERKDFLVEIEDDIDDIDEGDNIVPKHKRPPGDKIALVKFDGTAITTNGNLVRHNWFKGLQLNQAKYSDIMLTAEEAQQLHAAHTQMRLGASSSTPMVCYGAEVCPMASKCGFVAIQKEIDARGENRLVVPIGKVCPIEQDLLFEWVARYAEDFGVTDAVGNFTDQRLLLELAECEVLENRMNAVLSTKYQDLTEDKVVAVMQDEYGQREQHVKEIADAMRIKEKLEIKKDKIHKKLVATRFDQYKREAALKETNKNDNANLQAELTARLKRLEAISGDK